jgi:hypothetical protein
MRAYRYVGPAEALWILETGRVVSRSGVTWYAIEANAPLQTAADVSEVYALTEEKTHSIGPIQQDECPPWDAVGLRTVMPARLPGGRWVPGGGTEAATYQEHWMPALRKLR